MSNKNLVTLGPIGYIRGGGTIATVCTIPLVISGFLLLTSVIARTLLVINVALLIYALLVYTLPLFNGVHDPREIVLDEVLGCFVTYLFSTITPTSIIIGLFFFRFFDISKIGFIAYCERMKGPAGILFDDIAAGLCAAFFLWIIGYSGLL